MVELLLAHGADSQSALNHAAKSGQLQAMRLLMRKGAKADADALVMAVGSEQAQSARLLIACGAPVNKESRAGFTGLHCAAYNGNTDIVALLLEQGADPRIFDRDGRTAAEIAEEEGWDEIVALLNR